MTRLKIAIYARVSTKDKGQDTENQLAQLRDFARRQKWTIGREYVDRKTGKTGDRDEFQRMFADAEQRKFDLVLFWALDRFSREGVRQTLSYLERLTTAGVDWRSFMEPYLDSCGTFKDAVLAILAVIAKQEHLRIAERTLAGLERARKAGKRIGRPSKKVDLAKIKARRKAGATFRAIAAELKVSPALIHGSVGRPKPAAVGLRSPR